MSSVMNWTRCLTRRGKQFRYPTEEVMLSLRTTRRLKRAMRFHSEITAQIIADDLNGEVVSDNGFFIVTVREGKKTRYAEMI